MKSYEHHKTGLCKRQGRVLGVKYVGFRSAERTRVGYLILSDSTLRNQLYRLFYIIFSGLPVSYSWAWRFDPIDLIGQIIIDNRWTQPAGLRDTTRGHGRGCACGSNSQTLNRGGGALSSLRSALQGTVQSYLST